MFLSTFLSWLESIGQPTTQGKARLVGELLESRCVPANFLWAATNKNGGNWSDVDKWLQEDPVFGWNAASRVPGQAGDAVQFGGKVAGIIGSPYSCTVDVQNLNIASVTVTEQYHGYISLKEPLTISKSLTYDAKGSWISGYDDKDRGLLSYGTLNIAKNAEFNWYRGTLLRLHVNIEGGGGGQR